MLHQTSFPDPYQSESSVVVRQNVQAEKFAVNVSVWKKLSNQVSDGRPQTGK